MSGSCVEVDFFSSHQSMDLNTAIEDSTDGMTTRVRAVQATVS